MTTWPWMLEWQITDFGPTSTFSCNTLLSITVSSSTLAGFCKFQNIIKDLKVTLGTGKFNLSEIVWVSVLDEFSLEVSTNTYYPAL